MTTEHTAFSPFTAKACSEKFCSPLISRISLTSKRPSSVRDSARVHTRLPFSFGSERVLKQGPNNRKNQTRASLIHTKFSSLKRSGSHPSSPCSLSRALSPLPSRNAPQSTMLLTFDMLL